MQERLVVKQPARNQTMPYNPYATFTRVFPTLLGLSFFLTELFLLLGYHPLLLSLTGSLGLRTLGIHLLFQDSLTGLLGLGSVDLS